MASSFPSSNPSAFLALPMEIRQHVYRFCIPHKLRYDVSSTLCFRNCPNWFNETFDKDDHGLERSSGSVIDKDGGYEKERKLPAGTDLAAKTSSMVVDDTRNAIPELLLCCHQITEEVIDLLYGENTFQVNLHDDDEFTLADLLNFKTRRKIRKLVLILRPRGVSYRPNYSMEPEIWDGILSNLQVLGVIAEQPESHSEEDGAFEEWNEWIAPIFEYLHRALNREAKIMVDANDEQKTIEIIQEAIPERCQFQRLTIADYIFKRGKFASAAGFWAGYWDHIDDHPSVSRDYTDDNGLDSFS
jgi:hypothetical protein